ncbi:hypothetical protein EON67_04580 [archaeon]|nr:MAG: hypothetical protein EON67_04580 [archaeon]
MEAISPHLAEVRLAPVDIAAFLSSFSSSTASAPTQRTSFTSIVATVRELDPEARVVHLSDGRVLSYDAALIASGSAPNSFFPHPALLALRDTQVCITQRCHRIVHHSRGCAIL